MLIHPNFDPVAISIGSVAVHWYGLMYLCGFGSGLLLGRYRAGRSGQDNDWSRVEIGDLLFYIAAAVIIGGRLGYVLFYNFGYYLREPLAIFALWDGGMSFHGGLIGVMVGLWLYARKTHRPFLAVGDFIAPLIPPGLFFGRIGNFINQELWGRPTDLPWGVWFYTAPDLPRHPSQLYQALGEGLVLFLLLWWFSAKPRARGQVCGVFLIGYSLLRFGVEFFREPDGHIGTVAFGWLSMGQLLSLPMLIIGAYLLLRRRW